MSYDDMPKFKNLLFQRNDINSMEEVQSALGKMYLEYAISTVYRGNLVKNIILQHINIRGKKYLDVGCAYGGFLTAFEREGAVEVTGIDINEGLLDYSRALIDDYKSNAKVYKKDILKEEEVLPLGKFDLITCNDVIEHVENPKLGLKNMVSMLNEKGTLFMQIPNRLSASFIQSDGHFQLFGISILPKPLADRYYNKIYPNSKHDVTYKSMNYYINNLKQMGMECRVIKGREENKDKRLNLILNNFQKCKWLIYNDKMDVPEEFKEIIIKRTLKLERLFKKQYYKYLKIKDIDREIADVLADKLILKFGEDFWILMAMKPECK